jgi:opacity protein-like surface antigen
MKKLLTFCGFFLLLNWNTVSFSQKLSLAVQSGISFSDIHGNASSGKWKFKPGSSAKMTLGFDLNRVIGIETGLNFLSVYYEHLPYVDRTVSPEEYWESLPPLFPPQPQSNYNRKMDFSYLSVPAQVKISIPSTPRLSISAGAFYSFLIDYSLNYYSSQEPVKNDLGLLFSTGLSYPLSDNINALLNVGYMTGKKRFLDNYTYRNGSMDVTFGISYDGFIKGNTKNSRKELLDSSESRINLMYKTGINFLWNSCSLNPEMYEIMKGASLGLLVDFNPNKWLSLQTGISYEKSGYALKDSSNYFYRYYPDQDPQYYVDTRIGIDYVMIPVIVNVVFGNQYKYYFGTGSYLAFKLNAFCTGEAFSSVRSYPEFLMIKTVVSDDIEEMVKGTDFGWIIRCGIIMPVTKRIKVDLGLQYNKGFRDAGIPINSEDIRQVDIGETLIRNNSLSFQLGIRVPVY